MRRLLRPQNLQTTCWTENPKVRKNGVDFRVQVNLAKIHGTGDFACPKCGVTISPDDETDDAYSIKEQKTRRDVLEEILIQCNQCKILIRLTGFRLLDGAVRWSKKINTNKHGGNQQPHFYSHKSILFFVAAQKLQVANNAAAPPSSTQQNLLWLKRAKIKSKKKVRLTRPSTITSNIGMRLGTYRGRSLVW